MLRQSTFKAALVCVGLACAPSFVQAQSAGNQEAHALAKRIDNIIDARLQKESIKPGAKASEAEIARRLHIDLTGRIPTLLQIRDYLENDSPDRHERRVDELLASPHFAANFANYYRSVMLGNSNSQQAQALQGQFESWLREKLAANVPYDKIAHQVISLPNNAGGVSPAAFNFANENKAENLAGATARVFLGVKIECAQCHKHPFAKWTRQQFWEFAAFFGNNQQRGGGAANKGVKGGPTNTPLNPHEIRIPDTDKVVQARFITGETPDWKDNPPPRTVLADWITSPRNPYFTKAAVDAIWQYMFGTSLTEPIFEPTDSSPTHPELLEELSKSFSASGYDVKFLIRAIALTDAYQRSSVAYSDQTKDDIQLFARMPFRGMMPEQLFDSFAEALDSRQESNINDNLRQVNFGGPGTPRQQFLAKFTSQDRRIETQTSILQALFLMNGKFLADRVKLENNEALRTIATAPTTTARRVETLYLMVLSRPPRPEEAARYVDYIENGGGRNDPQRAVADIYWALLNSSEFALNH